MQNTRNALTNLLTETDGPVTYRKSPYNCQLTRPSFMKTVVAAVAEVKNMAVIDVATQIAENFEGFFNIKLNYILIQSNSCGKRK
jgi:Tat protein secretion system quality control protein TatD with DNase activity